eukprot:GDKK01003254.1.p2 GENE.GDKK01003254.1~~GDKK01003254.1.p2  ORF type:complete len:101 (-),score=5.33 GDKK01003254.1:195-497(-)
METSLNARLAGAAIGCNPLAYLVAGLALLTNNKFKGVNHLNTGFFILRNPLMSSLRRIGKAVLSSISSLLPIQYHCCQVTTDSAILVRKQLNVLTFTVSH